MINSDFKQLDLITASYFDKATVLFNSIAFFHYSIHTCSTYEVHAQSLALSNLKKSLSKSLEQKNSGELEAEVLMRYMPSLCFFSLVSAFEDYMIEISMFILKKYPQKIAKETVDFKLVIELTKEEILEIKSKEYLNGIMYKKPKEYMNSICDLLGVDSGTIKEEFYKYIEIKARRDLGIHNQWMKNDIYIRKLGEVGMPDNSDIYMAPNLEYFNMACRVCGDLVRNISNGISTKVLKCKPIMPLKKQSPSA
ncbi:hypothetical protein QZQ97_08365 [Serratia sp. root2]|uniref:hypothetical protein n=1 Tax=Serratia sp. root2 TaxID=3059676 RepID=UPI00288CED86|nr:hypothetical protein [Serratia sp. root2]MDT3250952.1 hypothetical protein [Serratia sp. root2]